tara:strand:+ start:411 stop:779 length:369 start_codon:yes stop_codon:yes gene_type:complete
MPSCRNKGGKRRSRNRSRSRMRRRRSRGGTASAGMVTPAAVAPTRPNQSMGSMGSYGASPYGGMMYTGKGAGGGFMPNATQSFYTGGKKRKMSKRKGRKTKKHRKSKRRHYGGKYEHGPGAM